MKQTKDKISADHGDNSAVRPSIVAHTCKHFQEYVSRGIIKSKVKTLTQPKVTNIFSRFSSFYIFLLSVFNKWLKIVYRIPQIFVVFTLSSY